ncbi:DUF5937 family protein [Streptomyces sp. NPDC087917]|uniref:ArsR/SmtB family transcription factor n=1 Tax=Streptomyces sp. NPDC087917 TaxID=3155060 RepID=UPI003415530F
MRFAVSPMWEVGTSLRLLASGASGASHAVHGRWVEQVRPRLAASGLDRGRLAELVPRRGFVPDFLNPAPDGPAPTLERELARIVASSAAAVRRDLDRLEEEQGGLGPRSRALYADPRAHLPRVAEEIELYWESALAPYWARIRAVLDADVLHRSRRVAEQGVAHLFNDLHASLSWSDNGVRFALRRGALSRGTAGPGLVLLPSAFAGPFPLTRVAPPEPPQVAYPARGTGTLWEPRAAAPTEALAAVLGRSRSRLLAELGSPASTTELAARTGLSASGVSQYLTALRDAGLVSAHRAGRSVLYARTTAGESLLGAGSGPDVGAGADTDMT